MLGSNITDQLLNQHGLTYTGTAEQTDLTTFCIGSQQIDNLDTGLQHLYYRTLLFEGRWISVDDPMLLSFQGFSTVDGLSQYVEQSTQCLITYRHLNSFSGSNDIHILAKSFTGTQHDAANGIVANMLCHFHDQTLAFTVYFQGILDKGKIIVLELYVYNRSHDLDDLTMIFFLYVTQLFRTSFLAFFFFF